ncbi:MAG: hypothetical protein JXB13_09080 [Phycisphaerae bacterium]|nr:hypothetical protein [Phycisphaerae bacterium]
MNAATHPFVRRTGLLFCLLFCALDLPSAKADVRDAARRLPDDTVVMVSVESVRDLRDALKRTSWYELYQDPAMQPLVRQIQEKVRQRVAEGIKKFWQEMELDAPPEEIPWPEGRLVLGFSVSGGAAQAGASGSAADTAEDTGLHVVLLADMGSRVEQARELMRALSADAGDSGDTVERRDVGGMELDVITAEEKSDYLRVCTGVKDTWLLVNFNTNDNMSFIESVAKRLGRSLPGHLGEKPGFASAVRALGEADVFVFVNADGLKQLAADKAKDKGKAKTMIEGLGLDNVTALATTLQIAGRRNQNTCTKTLLAVQGAKQGVPALLSPASAPLRLNDRLVTQDAVGFLCANVEPAGWYDGIAGIVRKAVFFDIHMMVQAVMMATAQGGGQPPVQFRDEVLGQMAAPFFATWKADRPYTTSTTAKVLMGFSVRDADRLDAAVSRVHHAFSGGREDLRRELLGHTLYLLPTPGSMGPEGTGATPPGTGQRQIQFPLATFQGGGAFAVAGDHIVFGPVEEVEQAMRSLQKDPARPLTSDPMFRYAREYLPSQAAAYYYRNDRLNAEMAWAMVQQAVQEMSNPPAGAPEKERVPLNPIVILLQELGRYVDWSELPDFKAMEKYWGATVGFVQARSEGIYCETTVLKPRPQ